MHNKNRLPLGYLAILCLITAPAISDLHALGPKTDRLERGFVQRPQSAQPRVYWWWLNSNVSKAGITRDLEEMKRKGIGGALVVDAGGPAGPTPAGPRFMGPEWRGMFQHAVAEADRLGLEISLNLCSGWNSGGPWIEPEHACQKVVWSETIVEGPLELSRLLPLPSNVETDPDGNPIYYQDIVTQAFDARVSRSGSMNRAAPKISANSQHFEQLAEFACDGDETTYWSALGYPSESPARNANGSVAMPDCPSESPSESSHWLQLEFDEPFTTTSLYLNPRGGYGPEMCELQSMNEAGAFKTFARFRATEGKATTIDYQSVSARTFRLLITSSYSPESALPRGSAQVREIQLLQEGEERKVRFPIKNWRLKSANTGLWKGRWTAFPLTALDEQHLESSDDMHIDPASLLDLSEQVDASGRLTWKVPAGKWSILRIGHTLTGMQVSTHSPEGGGHMLDFFSGAAMKLQFDTIATKLLKEVGPLAGKSLKYFHDDSWEVGSPNWTVEFPEEFQRRRGYDLAPYLPVLAGYVIQNHDVSNRFLWDFRRTIADCIAENHYGVMRDLSKPYGIGIHPESGGPFFPHIDALQCLGKGDIPMGEFWDRATEPDGPIPWRQMHDLCDFIKQAASAAHVYGKKNVQAEAFTTVRPHWEKSPFELKDVVDHAFCQGLTRVMFHTFTHSPAAAGLPGDEYFAGTHFNPNITWWEQADAWTGYIARCQFLLQQGLFVGDVCYYYGEGVPNYVPAKRRMFPTLPAGYDHDVIDSEALLSRMTVRDGRLVLPDGMSYHLLVLPESNAMSPVVLRKIVELAENGATIVGPKPDRAPGLRDYPHADQLVQELADQLWGPCAGVTVTEHRYGKGRIVWDKPLGEILLADGVPADCQITGSKKEAEFDYIHRRTDTAEIYFISNQENRWERFECSFRVSGKVPELWEPDTGRIREQIVYDVAEGRTMLSLRLAPYGSVFVVFRDFSSQEHVVSILQNGDPIFPGRKANPRRLSSISVVAGKGSTAEFHAFEPGRYELTGSEGNAWRFDVESIPRAWEIPGPWEVRFPKGWGAPESTIFEELRSWTEDSDPGVKYFSGTALYRKEFDVPASLIEGRASLFLDLGRVKNIAEVKLNGSALGILWKPPFRVDISDRLEAGHNVLEVEVTNLWPNRLIGDAFLPEKDRHTRTNVTKFNKDSPLLQSGLLGPVRIFGARVMEFDRAPIRE